MSKGTKTKNNVEMPMYNDCSTFNELLNELNRELREIEIEPEVVKKIIEIERKMLIVYRQAMM